MCVVFLFPYVFPYETMMLCATLGATKEQHMAERLPDSALPHTVRINRSAIFIVGCLAAPTLVVCCRPRARRSCTDTCKTPSLHSRDTAKQTKSASPPRSGSPSLAASHPSRKKNYRNCSHLFPLKNSNQSGSPEATLARTLIPIQEKEKKKKKKQQ